MTDAKPAYDAPIEEIEAYMMKGLYDDGEDEPTTKGGGIARLDPRLIQAQAEGATSLLLEVQQECIQWRKRAEGLKDVLEGMGLPIEWVDGPELLWFKFQNMPSE